MRRAPRRTTNTTVFGAVGALVAIAAGTLAAGALTPGVATAATSATALRAASSTTLYGAGPYRSDTSEAAKQVTALATSDPAGAAAATTIARYPVAIWLGDWTQGATLTKTIDAAVAGAERAGTTPVFVTYAIPQRDCGGYSAGGFDEATYDAWVDQIVARLAGHRAAVVVEPDSLAMLSNAACSDVLDQQRYRILSREVAAFTAAGIPAYLDAGNSNWVAPATIAARLTSAGVQNARGFFTNVANYYPTAQEQAYAEKVSAATGGSHYVIDTSRNGQGWRGTWCNGPGSGLGTSPRTVSDGTGLDALLWVKTPGASDGTCGGAPAAGKWWSTFAQALVANARLGTPVVAAPAAPAAVAPTAVPTAVPTPAATATATATPTPTATASPKPTATATPTPTASASPKPTATTTPTPTASASPKPTATAKPTVKAPAVAPQVHFESVASGTTRRVTVRGWVFDRDDLKKPVSVRVTVAGKTVGTATANVLRPDVDRVYHVGRNHGVAATVPVPSGRRSVCLTAIGIGGGGNTSMGCKTLTVR